MKPGRPAKRERTPFGQRLHTLREQVGLSQQQLADRLGLTQRAYAHWERNPVGAGERAMKQLAPKAVRLRDPKLKAPAAKLREEGAETIALTRQVMARTRARVFAAERHYQDKVLSIF